MRLQNHPNPNPELFLECAGKTVPTDEEHISDAISLATEEIAGNGKGISSNPLTLANLHGQPEDIYEQISKIIMEFITPEESIILNVMSASVDFTTCESIRMSQKVDKTGQRTLAIVTKADKSPEGLLEKVTADDVSIGLGYVCVRNRIGDESYEDARAEEAKLFDTHCFLSKIDKSMVGVPVLAERLVRIQANIIVKCRPEIVRKINEKLSGNIEELNKLPKHLTSVGEAMAAFMHVVGSAKESLRKILIHWEFDEYPDACGSKKYLLDEIMVLEEGKSIGLPNFLPKVAFHTLMQRKVKSTSAIPFEFLEKIWGILKRAAQNLIAKMKQESVDWVNEIVEMEKVADYTSNPTMKSSVPEAFDLGTRVKVYWDIVLRRMVDNMALHLLFKIRNLVKNEMEMEIVNEIMGPHGNGLERMMDESPSVALKRNKLKKSISLLKESKDVVANIIDKISDNFDY
ncbi:hypothetical protein MIMGU_mgv1a018536mg [Erythranthe guttata]|uniref:GED domain-containing protein n=1 Tax=Erythranthe guttata TaxID=4155 RepID=A0A022RK68_ERYGU|nr:hypothetical protein MIMGU_mgv1a018536mg [Erythranthe guttata]